MRNIFTQLQLLGQSLMLPVSVLPAAGLLLRFGEKDLLNMPAVKEAGMAVFANLPLIFAVGVAIGFSGGQAVAALAAVVGHLILLAVLKSLSPGTNAGVFSGIAMGITAAILYKEFHQVRLPRFLGFFAGKRFVLIITAVAAVIVALIFEMVWPELQKAIDIVGRAAVNSSAGPALFAAGKRLLIPIGLHHVYYPTFLYEFGQYMTPDGQVIKGDFYRYFAGDPTAGVFMASEFPIMMFGLPAAALAIYYNARPERRKAIAGLMASAALASFLTGITEPIEFAFIFAAPELFIFHVLMAGISGLMTSLLDIHLGFTFSASFIDYLLSYKYGRNQLLLWPVGVVTGILYFCVFHLAINKLDLKTPGREAEAIVDTKMGAVGELAVKVLESLGGANNIEALDSCISRLRVTVKQPGLVKIHRFKALGASGVMDLGRNLQIIFGTQSDSLKEEIAKFMGRTLPNNAAVVERKPNYKPPADTCVRIKAPVSGRIIQLEEMANIAFEQAFPGDGVAIKTSDNVCIAPVDGKVTRVFLREHALSIRMDVGCEVLIRVALNADMYAGGGYMALVSEGQQITVGQKIFKIGSAIAQEDLAATVSVVISEMEGVEITPAEEVTAGEDTILQFERSRILVN